MIGQGSPNGPRRSLAWQRQRLGCWKSCLVAIATLLCALAANRSVADETDLRLRIAWGGGQPRQWDCSIRVSEGTISEPLRLALEPDTPGSMAIRNGQLLVLQRSARAYDGVDVRVTASLQAELSIVLTPADGRSPPHRDTVPLADLVSGVHHADTDEQRNQLVMHRTPGDQVRFDLDRDSLVFAAGEEFVFSVVPHQLGLAEGTGLNCELELISAETGDDVWSDDRSRKVMQSGHVPRVGPFAVKLPEEGVYELHVLVESKGFTPLQNKKVAQRKIQLVVVAEETTPPDAAQWEEVVEIDPAKPGWWERIKRLPQLKLIPGFGRGPITHGESHVLPTHGTSLVELEPESWQAFPLPIDNVGVPHILEVEYPADLPQTLSISIVEPNAAGSVLPIGLDSGVNVSSGGDAGRIVKHRLIFWPRTTAPLALLTNRRDDGPAAFGKLRVLAGPKRLPPAAAAQEPPAGRTFAAYFDKPLFPENFGADEALDPVSNRTLDDWNTFYLGGRRLVEYLKHVGYNSAMLSVLCEGSTLYPSELLEPTPKYDSGMFFPSGQDPLRKDVLEMLFRMFDRENLTLVPTLQFSTPLPELERLRRQSAEDAEGIDLVNWRGMTRLDNNGAQGGLAAYYNPLDPRVQQAVLDAVDEIAARYAHHRSFGGLVLQLGPDTYVQLPDQNWGYDWRTVARFGDHMRFNPVQDREALARRIDYLRRNGREAWLRWRAEELAAFHKKVQQQISRHRRGATLYLSTSDLFASQKMQSMLRPSLPPRDDFARSAMTIGLDSDAYRDHPNIVLLRPQRLAPLQPPAARRLDIRLQRDAGADRFFETGGLNATLVYHESPKQRLSSFEEKSPFGAEKTHLWLVPHLSPSQQFSRRRFARNIAATDAHMLVDGGWMLPLGQEESVKELVEVFRRLPAARFQTATPQSSSAAPVVIRTLQRQTQAYVYLVNDSPWEMTVEVQLDADRACQVSSLSQRELPPIVDEANASVWRLKLQPYDLVGAVLSDPNVRVLDWRSQPPEHVAEQLRQELHDLRAKANRLSALPPLNVLHDAGFEQANPQGTPGWVHARGTTIDVQPDARERCEGSQSLRVTSRHDIAWLRSAPFAPPKTGRVSVTAKLKTADPNQQPPLRLALEYMVDGEPQYQFAEVGAGRHAPVLQKNWEKFVFHVDNLPAAGVTAMQVGFDLMGPGQVWIDDVQVFDRWFDDNENAALLKSIALAGFQLEEGNVGQCQAFLEGYWPRFLDAYVPLQPRVAKVEGLTGSSSASSQDDSKSVIDRMKGWLPKRVFPF